MRILSKRTIVAYWTRCAAAEDPLRLWHGKVKRAKWEKPQDIRDMFGASVDFVGDSRVVFDIGGNRFRMVVRVAYGPCYRVMIKFIGTHAEYDRIDVERI